MEKEYTKPTDNITIYDQNWTEWLDMQLYGPKNRWLRHLIGECLKHTDGEEIKSILDVGCGEGTITYFIAQKFLHTQVDGTDISQAGINNAQHRWDLPNLHFYHDTSLACLKNNYDAICCFEVLEHVEDWQELINQFSTSAIKYMVLSFPVGRMRSFERGVGHLRNFQKGEVESYLLKRGFSSLCIFYAGFPFYSPLYRNLCDAFNAPESSFTRGKYGLSQKIVSQLVYVVFRFCSTKRSFGEQFCGLFRKN